MTPTISVNYITNRKEPRIDWFFSSLARQPRVAEVEVNVIDRWAAERKFDSPIPFRHYEPKPCVYSGPHRKTSRDYFAAANARNTGICYSSADYICFVDDRAVLSPNWLDAMLVGREQGWVVCGGYRKVLGLTVADGLVTGFQSMLGGSGEDTRYAPGCEDGFVACNGEWFYGATCGVPTELILRVNGYPEACDGVGFEDALCGLTLRNVGAVFRYTRRASTIQDASYSSGFGNQPSHRHGRAHAGFKDISWQLLQSAQTGSRAQGTMYDLAERRQKTLAGEPFPVPEHPYIFPDGKPAIPEEFHV